MVASSAHGAVVASTFRAAGASFQAWWMRSASASVLLSVVPRPCVVSVIRQVNRQLCGGPEQCCGPGGFAGRLSPLLSTTPWPFRKYVSGGQPSAGGRVAASMAELDLSEATRGPPDRLAGGDNRYGRYPRGNIQTWNGGGPLCRRLPEHADESIDVRFVIVNVGADAHQAEAGADEHLFGLHTPDHVVGHACGKPQ
jgi:hypothetical protein